MLIMRLFGFLGIATLTTLAVGQTPHDYYTAQSTAVTAELLRNVESYHLAQGIQETRDRRQQAAWADFDFILRYFPNHPRALVLMGETCAAWPTLRCDMESYFAKAITMSPESDGIYLTQGVYLQKTGKLKDAIKSYQKALELNPESANTHYNLGLAYLANKQNRLANEEAQKAYSLGMTFPGLRNKLVAAGAWKVIESTPPVAETANPPSANSDDVKASEAPTKTDDGAK